MANTAIDDLANSQFFYSNVSPITTDFSVSPYYDDFDDNNNFYKILFKPGYAVQARELTQIQSILQNQISKFGQHIFKEGSMVLGGKFTIDTRANFVKVNDKDLLGNDIDITTFEGQIVTGQTTGIRAYVSLTLDGTESSDKPKTLYVSYLSGNQDTGEVHFTANEPLVSNVGTLVVGNSVPVGFGSVFTINEGYRFAKEHFIHHTKQSVVVDRYDINPTCKVGFYLEESIVNSSEDSSLLDPALESSNFSAPGADRFKITPILTRLDIDDTAGYPDYVNLFVIERGKVTEINERPMYNVLRDELAKRTMDESGHYYVRGFNPVLEEHLKVNGNGGLFTSAEGGDSQVLSVQIESGTGYVKGYEINKLTTQYLTTPKSTTFANVNGQVISSKVGSYIIANEAVGAWNINIGQSIDLYDTAQQRVTNGASSTGTQTGNKIGTAKVKSISKDSGNLGTPGGAIRIHLFDISMLGSNSFSSVKSVYYDNSTNVIADIGADVILTANTAKFTDVYGGLLYYTGSNHTKTIRANNGTIDTTYYFKKTSDVSIVGTTGEFSITSSVPSETFPYTGSLSAADKADIFLNVNANVNVFIGIAATGSGNTLTSSGLQRLNIGDKLEFSGNSGTTYTITSINDPGTSLVVNKNLPTISSNSIYKAYKIGDMIDLSSKGNTSGTIRSASVTSGVLTINLQETYPVTVPGTVTYTMARSGAKEVRKVLRRNRYVLIDCSTNAGANTGPYSLGISDVYRINSIRQSTSAFTSVNDGSDVSTNFVVDNGQRDNSYKNARIIPFTTLTPSDKLLVCLDYFEPDFTLGVGYFSVDSYPVNDISTASDQITTAQIPVFRSPDTGIGYDLRNYFDFRPVYTNSAADATSLTGITTNPVESTTLRYESSGLRLPADSEPIIYDYSYYLGRKDIVTLNQNGDFMITKGVPAATPITPSCPQHLMPIAKMYISPYPSLSPSYAKLLGRADLASSCARTSQVRFTMKDIGVLKQRVDNLENYVSLSLLEKSALDLKILDENQLDRFKNGIFVDSFTSFTLSDYGNPDHHICYDPREGSIRPIHETQAIGYRYNSGSNVVVENNILMLPYTEVAALTQPFATTYRNVETTVYRFIGKLYLDPDADYWVNDKRLASQTFSFGATDADITPYSIVYGSFQTVVTGVSTSDPVLLSSTGSTSGSTGGTNTTSTYFLNFNPNHQGGEKYNESIKTIQSLINVYGGSTPITFSGESLGGWAGLVGGNVPAGTNLQTYFSNIKTLSDLLANKEQLLVLNNFSITIVGTTGGVATTSTTNTYQTITTTGTQASRTFTETFQSIQTDTQSIGDKVVAVAPIADIRPQTISFEARGLKATTRHYVYFDGLLMSEYVTPATSNTAIVGSNTKSIHITATGQEGSSLYSNDKGIAYGFLRIPSDSTRSFRTGSKEIIITDSPSDEPDATSSAKGYFHAQGITQTLQETIISTSYIVTEQKSGVQENPIVYSNTTNTYAITTNTTVTAANSASGIIIDHASCMAYSFKLNTPRGEEGTFLSSVDVFFAGKDPSLGVWFEIRTMDNGGTITKVQVPDSEVWLEPDQVNIPTNDIPVATNVKFKNPIFLLNNQEYAFIIHTVGVNPNYYMYVCVLGKDDIVTKLPVNDRPLTGTLYTTNNNTDWDIVPRTDLKVTFYRASFQTNVVGEAILGNEHREFIQLPLTPATGANTSWFGERILGNDNLNLSAPTGIIVGDYIIGSNSTTNTTVASISGSVYSMNNTGYSVGEPVTVRRANGYLTAITSTVVSKNTASGRIYDVKPKNDTTQFNGNTAVLTVDSTNGLFGANDVLHMEFSGNTVNSLQVTKQVYSAIQFEPSYIDFIPTTCDFYMAMTSNTGTQFGYDSVVLSNIIDLDTEMAIYSRSKEISDFAGVSSNRVKVQMSTVSDYMSPIVNLGRTYTVYINNLINSNTANELLPSGGSLKNKYLSQIITLADGQDAEDLQIILSAYRPPGTNCGIKVYVRVANGEDFESIYAKNWIEMEPYDDTAYSSLKNRKDWREFQYNFPSSVMTGTNDQGLSIIQYTNSANTTFEGFKQYQIKIGLRSDTSAIYPRVADLRAIALQK